MKVARFLALGLGLTVLCLGSLAVHAQNANSFDGKWKIKFTNNRGLPSEAILELKGTSGQFTRIISGSGRTPDPCVSITAPVSAQTAGDELVLSIKNSEVLKGCMDMGMKLKKVSDRAMDGAFGNGTAASAARE